MKVVKNLKVEPYSGEDKIDDDPIEFIEDIPFPDGWIRLNVDEMKRKFCDWLDNNIQEEYEKDPEFYLKENEKRFYFRVVDEGYTDEPPDPEDEGYRCVFVPFENERVEMTDVKF